MSHDSHSAGKSVGLDVLPQPAFTSAGRRLRRRAGVYVGGPVPPRRADGVQWVSNKEYKMTFMRKAARAAGAVALALAMASCATTNSLDPSEFWGARLSARMQTPPEPRMHVSYELTIDSRRPVYSALSVLTNLAKASQAEKADRAMRDALDRVNVPEIIFNESFAACANMLGASRVEAGDMADYALDLDITDWGVRADAPGSPVTLHMDLRAGLHRTIDGELVWQRNLTVDEPASPGMFGLGEVVGTMVTATALSDMSPDALADGFSEMARSTARGIARLLQRDLDRARSFR
jgi:hypothetical protein